MKPYRRNYGWTPFHPVKLLTEKVLKDYWEPEGLNIKTVPRLPRQTALGEGLGGLSGAIELLPGNYRQDTSEKAKVKAQLLLRDIAAKYGWTIQLRTGPTKAKWYNQALFLWILFYGVGEDDFSVRLYVGPTRQVCLSWNFNLQATPKHGFLIDDDIAALMLTIETSGVFRVHIEGFDPKFRERWKKYIHGREEMYDAS